MRIKINKKKKKLKTLKIKRTKGTKDREKRITAALMSMLTESLVMKSKYDSGTSFSTERAMHVSTCISH